MAVRSLTELEKWCESRTHFPRSRSHPWSLLGDRGYPRLKLLEILLLGDEFGQRTLRFNGSCEKYSSSVEGSSPRGISLVLRFTGANQASRW